MKRLHFNGSISKLIIYPLPTVLVIDYANQVGLQLSWLIFNLDIIILKKGRHKR